MKKIIIFLVLIVSLGFVVLSAYDYVKSFDETMEEVPTEESKEETEDKTDTDSTNKEESKEEIEDKTDTDSMNKEDSKDKSIFNVNYIYQGYIDYDSTSLSSYCDSYYNDVPEKCVIDNGIDLKIMAEDVVYELNDNGAESVNLLIYFNSDVDTSDLVFEFYGIDSITIYGDNDVQKEFNVRYQQTNILNVFDFIENVGMINISINDFERVCQTGAYIKQV